MTIAPRRRVRLHSRMHGQRVCARWLDRSASHEFVPSRSRIGCTRRPAPLRDPPSRSRSRPLPLPDGPANGRFRVEAPRDPERHPCRAEDVAAAGGVDREVGIGWGLATPALAVGPGSAAHAPRVISRPSTPSAWILDASATCRPAAADGTAVLEQAGLELVHLDPGRSLDPSLPSSRGAARAASLAGGPRQRLWTSRWSAPVDARFTFSMSRGRPRCRPRSSSTRLPPGRSTAPASPIRAAAPRRSESRRARLPSRTRDGPCC